MKGGRRTRRHRFGCLLREGMRKCSQTFGLWSLRILNNSCGSLQFFQLCLTVKENRFLFVLQHVTTLNNSVSHLKEKCNRRSLFRPFYVELIRPGVVIDLRSGNQSFYNHRPIDRNNSCPIVSAQKKPSEHQTFKCKQSFSGLRVKCGLFKLCLHFTTARLTIVWHHQSTATTDDSQTRWRSLCRLFLAQMWRLLLENIFPTTTLSSRFRMSFDLLLRSFVAR